MRFLAAIFATWFAIALFPEAPPRPPASRTETVWMSTDCKDSRWYLEDSDDLSVTLACYSPQQTSDDGEK